MFVIFVAKIWSPSIHESSPKAVQTCLVRGTLRIFTHKGAHKNWRYIKFAMLFGMEPVNLLLWKSLHPNEYTQVGFRCQTQCSPHERCVVAILFLTHPPFIYLGITAQDNPFKANNEFVETRIPTFEKGTSNCRCSWKCSLNIPSHRVPLRYALCP